MAVEDSNLTIITQSDAQNMAESLFGGSAQPEAAQSYAASDFQALMEADGSSTGLTQSGLHLMMTNSVEIDGVTYEGGIMEYLSSQGAFGGSEGEGLDGVSFGGNDYAGGATSDDGFGFGNESGYDGGETADSPGGGPEASSDDGFV